MKFPNWWYKSGINKIGHPIIDHCIVKKEENGLIEVHSRPYSFSDFSLSRLMLQCKIYGINFRISGESTYSNDTLTIIFWCERDN